MSAKVAALIAAMHKAAHATNGPKAKGADEWLKAAQTNDALREAFKPVFGSKLPHRTKFGAWLKEHSGQQFGELFSELRLVYAYSTHGNAHRYAVETETETKARERREDAKEDAREFIDTDKELRAIGRLMKRAEAAEEAKREAAIPVPELKVTVASPRDLMHVPPPERPEPAEGDVVTEADGQRYLIGKRRTDEQGRVTQEKLPMAEAAREGLSRVDAPSYIKTNINGRDVQFSGQWYSETHRPGFTYAALFHESGKRDRWVFIATPPEAAVEPNKEAGLPPWAKRNASGTPVRTRQPTRAELANRHSQSEGPAYSGSRAWTTPITPINTRWTQDL